MPHCLIASITRILSQLFISLFIFSAALNANAQDTTDSTTFSPVFNTFITLSTANDIPSATPEAQFDCSDKIYAVIEIKTAGSHNKEHQLVVNWMNPGNKLEEKTRYKFTSYGEGTRIWAWLTLSAPSGAAIGRIFDPAFGMASFIGKWRAEIKVDDKKIATHPFEVLC